MGAFAVVVVRTSRLYDLDDPNLFCCPSGHAGNLRCTVRGAMCHHALHQRSTPAKGSDPATSLNVLLCGISFFPKFTVGNPNSWRPQPTIRKRRQFAILSHLTSKSNALSFEESEGGKGIQVFNCIFFTLHSTFPFHKTSIHRSIATHTQVQSSSYPAVDKVCYKKNEQSPIFYHHHQQQ